MDELAELRKEIDKIDKEILENLSRRIKLVEKVGNVKKKQAINKEENSTNFCRPSRETDLIKKLIKEKDENYDRKAIIAIWRQIISASLNHEQKIRILAQTNSIDNSNYWLAREHFGTFTEIKPCKNNKDILESINSENGVIGIVDMKPNKDDWWITLSQDDKYSNIKVCATIPTYKQSNTSKKSLAIAKIKTNKSESDTSLWVIQTNTVTELEKTLCEQDSIKINSKNGNRILISINKYQDDCSNEIEKIKNNCINIKCIGNYANEL